MAETVQLQLEWADDIREAVKTGEYGRALDLIIVRGQTPPDDLLEAFVATAPGHDKPGWRRRVERYLGRVRIVSERVK